MARDIDPDAVVIDPLAGTGIPSVQERPRSRARKRKDVLDSGATPAVQTLTQPVCPSGHPVGPSQKFCSECGQELKPAGPPQCRNGHVVDAEAKFCPSCGVELGQEPVYSAAGGNNRPRPDGELSPQELAERERQHARALNFGKENPAIAYAPGHAPPGGSVVIHFVADGFTAFGNVWVRGQEIEVWPGHPRWAEAQQWINYDTRMQYLRWKKEYFRPGPWPGERSYLAGIGGFEQLKAVGGEGSVGAPSEEELRRGDEAERMRGRRVPAPLRM